MTKSNMILWQNKNISGKNFGNMSGLANGFAPMLS